MFLFIPDPLIKFFFAAFFHHDAFQPLVVFRYGCLMPVQAGFQFHDSAISFPFALIMVKGLEFPHIHAFHHLCSLL